MAKNINIQCIPFTQNGIALFIFAINAKFIYNRFDVSRRIEDKEKGYQRSFTKTRINQIKKYIDKENGILPNSVLVNIDSGNYIYNTETNCLELEEEGPLGFIIDGQHRIWGSNEAETELILPVVATVDLKPKEQASLFVKINKSQRGVPVSLYLDLLDLTEGIIEDFDDEEVPAQRRAIEIGKRMNEDEDGPLFGLIRTTGQSGEGVALNEFVTKLKEYVDPKKGKLLNYGFEDQFKIFKIYFKAVKGVFLEQWESSDSLILKTVGFGGLLKAFYDIFQLVSQGGKSFSTENTIALLSLISDFKFDSDNLSGGGLKAQENTGKLIVSELKLAMKADGDMNVAITE